MQTVEIIHKHQDFIIIDKPCGISVHKDGEEMGFIQSLAAQLSLPQLWLIHRLDKVTSGLLILALNRNAAAELSELFAARRIQKTYLALSAHKPKKKQGLIIGDMEKARRGAWKLCKTKDNPAVTRFFSYSCEPGLRLFVLYPQSGKTHQLRVAMKSLGSPILGDALYGDHENSDRTYLHAYALNFEYRGQHFDIRCPPKCGHFFQRFSVLEALATALPQQ
ncbi:tRNA pseudouridine32 synthase/23S rRNA pseudouridine746 synthase [Mesocricetibacter intestinalis]|uniref:tRNA pseudouridine32 synthase/23S rRNA pseudouridine746 synthase n=1 Tax=Mesocricetibacter intestinalis TaxID=1521930 RepID=A0A4R6VE62_9PAST|nr:TIGR01621 family pseudouridine synthase [Mesocricetibacter intestinalis]TDQ59034.1 tRNA pseudouridine32 synthase/23S rRNA pseudouridine746 synthase [Mesocricetibacter intestinalis]